MLFHKRTSLTRVQISSWTLSVKRDQCGGANWARSLCVCMCVIVVTMRGWADVRLWVAVCFLAKISLHRPTCKTTFVRLTQSQAISQSFRVFITFRSMRDTTFFSFFETLFYTKLPFPLPWWSKDLLVDKLQVAGSQLRNPPVKFRHERRLHLAIDQHPACPNRGRLELWPRKWFLNYFGSKSVTLSMLIDLLTSTSTQVKIYTGLIASTDLWP